ncbi:hypothetical protein NDU88_006188 [Pleurodeles waltl]|uniref:Uncharacterized protein n=1 Tax=Pleurodeles waltl TaxID=8319 RepID=A0AAV7MBH9_PLEWA|nr:hypothetical protein NDU88_006188 [Pleurodeles waltl]
MALQRAPAVFSSYRVAPAPVFLATDRHSLLYLLYSHGAVTAVCRDPVAVLITMAAAVKKRRPLYVAKTATAAGMHQSPRCGGCRGEREQQPLYKQQDSYDSAKTLVSGGGVPFSVASAPRYGRAAVNTASSYLIAAATRKTAKRGA